jgi:DNA-3-methyladenine glycosylase
MWGPPGRAYVYLVYGLHHCLNVVTAERGVPEAVLLRAVEPIEGVDLMRERRGREAAEPDALARGPGNLARAFGVDRSHDGVDLRRDALRILVPGSMGLEVAGIDRSARIGVDYAGAWASRPLRWSVCGHPAVSRPPRATRPRES